MKKIIPLLLSLLLFFSCTKNDYLYSEVFQNETDYDVIVTNREGSPDFTLEVPAHSTKTFNTNDLYGLFTITSNQTDLNFNYNLEDGVNHIFCYEYMVLYKVYGTVESADITLNNSEGKIHQGTYYLPCEFGFDYFKDDFKYISAQSNGYGSLTVEYYKYDVLIDSDQCNGNFCIATASN